MYPIAFFLGVLLWFQLVQRPLFLLYNRSERGEARVTPRQLLLMARWGLRSDLISTAYLTAVPLLLYVGQALVPWVFLPVAGSVYSVAAGVLLGVVTAVDCGLYPYWKFKLDSSVLPYLKSLSWAFSSVSATFALLALGSLVLLGGAGTLWLQWFSRVGGIFHPAIAGGWAGRLGAVAYLLLGIGALFCIIRGLRRRPNNPSVSYYSPVQFFNHVALNPLYSFIYSLSVNDKIEGAFHTVDDAECAAEFGHLFPGNSPDPEPLLNTRRPNVLFIIWESFSSRFVESLGGQPGVTPNIERLAREGGILFTHMDCNSFRTDRGVVALLSGYLAQPTTSVIRMGKKLPHLPAFPRKFKELGYETTAVSGGDLTVFHMAEYYLTVGHDRIVAQGDMPSSLPAGKWGVHDHAALDWLFDDIMDKTRRGVKWYTTLQTLSSHEPWQVPYSRLLPDDPIANTFAYVDDALGRFIDRLKETPAWEDLLIVVTGDHGCNTGQYLAPPQYARVPLLLLGGAVKGPQRIDTIMSQTDIAATILGQMHVPHVEFIFSRDVMASSYRYPFSFHTFVNGFMFRDATGCTVVDNVTGEATIGPDDRREHKGRVILQYLYDDLAKR